MIRPEETLLAFNFDGKALTGYLNRWFRPWEITPHDLRRFFRTRLTLAGCPEPITKRLMGHSLTALERAYFTDGAALDVESIRPWVVKVEEQVFGV
jgi:integrase